MQMPKMSGMVTSPFGIPFSHGARKGAKHSEYACKGERGAKGERRLLFPMVHDLSHLCGTRTAIPQNRICLCGANTRQLYKFHHNGLQTWEPILSAWHPCTIARPEWACHPSTLVSLYGGSCSAEMTQVLHHGKKEPTFPLGPTFLLASIF